jgi:histidinol-phosphate aminotransferase
MGDEKVQDLLILDWNESPLGPPPVAVQRIIDRAHLLHRYPRGLMEEVGGLAARYLGVDSSQILLTSGVDEAIDITMSLAERGVGVNPGFDFNARVLVCGKPFLPIPLGSDWQPPRCAEEVTKSDVVFIAQPGNPTGNLIRQEWLDEAREAAGYFFMDETYQEFCSAPSVLSEPFLHERTVVYRSFAKAFGLAGIRVGCLVGHPDLIARLVSRRRFMPIDAVSLNAAAAVLEEPSFVRTLASHVLRARPELAAMLRQSGLFAEVRDTETNFVIARVRSGTADAVADTFASIGVRVKACGIFGLNDWIRVGVGSRKEQDLLAERLSAIRIKELSGIEPGR